MSAAARLLARVANFGEAPSIADFAKAAGSFGRSCGVRSSFFQTRGYSTANAPTPRGGRPGGPAAPAGNARAAASPGFAALGLGPLAGAGAAPEEGAAHAFFRSRWPIIAVMGFGASAALAYRVFSEPVVTQRVYLDFEVDGQPAGRVVVGLFGKEAPQTCENFAALASHERGFGYRGCPVHRLMRGWSVWAGDVTAGDGSGGVSVFGPSFPVETHDVRHRRGSVSMVLDEEGRLRSQFFFTLVTTPALDRKAAAFGRVVEGLEVLDRLSRLPTQEAAEAEGRPRVNVCIADCGVLQEPEQVGEDAASASAPAVPLADSAFGLTRR